MSSHRHLTQEEIEVLADERVANGFPSQFHKKGNWRRLSCCKCQTAVFRRADFKATGGHLSRSQVDNFSNIRSEELTAEVRHATVCDSCMTQIRIADQKSLAQEVKNLSKRRK